MILQVLVLSGLNLLSSFIVSSNFQINEVLQSTFFKFPSKLDFFDIKDYEKSFMVGKGEK